MIVSQMSERRNTHDMCFSSKHGMTQCELMNSCKNWINHMMIKKIIHDNKNEKQKIEISHHWMGNRSWCFLKPKHRKRHGLSCACFMAAEGNRNLSPIVPKAMIHKTETPQSRVPMWSFCFWMVSRIRKCYQKKNKKRIWKWKGRTEEPSVR